MALLRNWWRTYKMHSWHVYVYDGLRLFVVLDVLLILVLLLTGRF